MRPMRSGTCRARPGRRWPRPAACSACCEPTPARNPGSRCLAWPIWTICLAGFGPPACQCGTNAAAPPRTCRLAIQLAVFRLVQEALTNTMKHAGPDASAAVRLQLAPAEVRVDVEDDGTGRGAEPSTAGGGLTGMRERISAFGGDLDFGPRHPSGWQVTARLELGIPRRVMITVLLADDHPLIRKGFRLILDAEPDIEVAGEASDGTTAVSMASALVPDVVLMDVRMPGRDGIEATREIAAAGLPSKVLILTTFDLDDYVYAGLRAGASGFLLKDTQPDDLVAAIRTIAAGDSVLAPTATRRLIRRFTEQQPEQPSGQRAEQIAAPSPPASRTSSPSSPRACPTAKSPPGCTCPPAR